MLGKVPLRIILHTVDTIDPGKCWQGKAVGELARLQYATTPQWMLNSLMLLAELKHENRELKCATLI